MRGNSERKRERKWVGGGGGGVGWRRETRKNVGKVNRPLCLISGPGVDGACGPAEMLPHMQNQYFRRSSPSLLLSFSQHSRLLSSKKRELATHFSFLCMSTTVSGWNCWSFAIIGDQSLEVWQRALRMTGDTDAAKSTKLFFPFFFCLLPNIC